VNLEGEVVRVAVIGAGNVGSALARTAKRTGNEVTVTATGKERLRALGEEIGAETTTSTLDAVTDADVVLAIPFGAVAEVAGQISEAVAGKVVVDVTNPLKEDYSGLATTDRSGAELLQEQLPQAKVVKAFNTVLAANQDKGEIDGIQLDGFVAADADDAKSQVLAFLEQLGYRPIDAGPLAAARYLEAMAFPNISLNAGNGWPSQTGWKLVGPTA
jgi:predicted dinucleotide-binding enzyme